MYSSQTPVATWYPWIMARGITYTSLSPPLPHHSSCIIKPAYSSPLPPLLVYLSSFNFPLILSSILFSSSFFLSFLPTHASSIFESEKIFSKFYDNKTDEEKFNWECKVYELTREEWHLARAERSEKEKREEKNEKIIPQLAAYGYSYPLPFSPQISLLSPSLSLLALSPSPPLPPPISPSL